MDSTIVLELLPENLKGKDGQVKFSPKDSPFFGLYFSAHWCPLAVILLQSSKISTK